LKHHSSVQFKSIQLASNKTKSENSKSKGKKGGRKEGRKGGREGRREGGWEKRRESLGKLNWNSLKNMQVIKRISAFVSTLHLCSQLGSVEA